MASKTVDEYLDCARCPNRIFNTGRYIQGGRGSIHGDINDMIYDKYGHPYTNRDEMLRRLYVACSRASNQLVLSYGK